MVGRRYKEFMLAYKLKGIAHNCDACVNTYSKCEGKRIYEIKYIKSWFRGFNICDDYKIQDNYNFLKY